LKKISLQYFSDVNR